MQRPFKDPASQRVLLGLLIICGLLAYYRQNLNLRCLETDVYRAAHPRGLFVSVIQEPPVLSSREAVEELLDFSEKAGVDTLYVQVYRANRAWFDSKLADASPYRECRASVGEDPLKLLIRRAHERNIRVHAWFNLLSLSANTEAPILKKYGPSILTTNREPKNSIEDYRIDNQFFLEPGDLRVREELSAIVGEFLRGYPDIDGVQMDYIRYPDVRPAYGHTPENLRRFREKTGLSDFPEDHPAWRQWKYDQVTALVREIGSRARRMRPGIAVSTTGLVPYSRASLESFQDWKQWLKTRLVDFVTLMSYPQDLATYEKYILDAKKQLGPLNRVNFAVGAYRLEEHPEVFAAQWGACEESGGRSCVALHYGNLAGNSSLGKPLTDAVK